MSARDDQPATVPPPAGEDDAYSATTKVGAMPADLMERLRAEGLLPEEPEAKDRPTALPAQPSTSLEKRPTPVPPPRDGEPLPQLYSVVPPPEARRPSTKPPARPTGPPEPLDSVETPVAFTKPPASLPPPKLPRDDDDGDEEDEARKETTGLTRTSAAVVEAAPKPPSKATFYLVAALVLILLIVALVRLSR